MIQKILNLFKLVADDIFSGYSSSSGYDLILEKCFTGVVGYDIKHYEGSAALTNM